METDLRIAYLTSTFARPGDTFIRNEVNELRRLGAVVDTYSIRRPADSSAEEDVVRHREATDYVLEAGFGKLLVGIARMAFGHPLRFAGALALACRTAAPGIRGFALQMAYVVEAAYLASRLLERKTQILHNHIGENSATVAVLASAMSGIPFSLTIHGPYIFFAPHRWALGEKLSRAAFTACISHYCRSQCMMFAPQEAWPRLHVVRCSVQPIFIEEPPTSSPRQRAHFVCVGRLCVEKGQRVLIDAARQLIKPSPSGRGQGEGALTKPSPTRRGQSEGALAPNICISLIGDGPDRSHLERTIRETGLQDHVTILGCQSSEAIRKLLAEATALVIPSFAEGLPVVAMEALASRCPVIATNIAAMNELIQPGRNGWLIPAGSVEDLVAAMQHAARSDEQTLKQMGCTGRDRVLELHHPARQTEKLLSLLRSGATAGWAPPEGSSSSVS